MIIIPNVNKENSCFDCPVWSLCWDSKPTEDICKDRCPIIVSKHGRWKHHQYGNTAGYYECDNCGKINSYESNYCPKCGTRMDAQIGEDKSHPFAESVMMGMDEVEEC